MDYTINTIKVAKQYNLNERDVLFCQLIANGANKGEAYYVIYEHGTKSKIKTIEQANTAANEFLRLNKGATVLIQRLKNNKKLLTDEAKNQVNATTQEEEENDERIKKFSDKSYIIGRLAVLSDQVGGKERAQILMQIADLQRMKQEENQVEEERRKFYLPYVSHCRTCKILEVFKELTEEKEK